jgi:outer membrane receptor protein involved in Fe transport
LLAPVRRVQRFRFVIGVKRRWVSGRRALSRAAALAALAPAAAVAQTASPPAPRPPASSPTEPRPAPGQDDIIVTAPSQQSSIDRQTYLVRDTAEARSATSLDILSRLPSVEVQADNSVRLVGAGTATVLIDGRRVTGDPATVLRNLQGAQIERIEVMTNPGAQFPAQGTGGIVNIVTRRNFQNGLGGSATGTGGRFDTYELRLAPTYGTGNWTFSGNASYFRGDPHADYQRERFTFGAGGPILDSTEAGEERDPYRYFVGNGTISYRPSERQTFTLTGTAAHGDFTLARDSQLTAAALPGGSAAQRSERAAAVDFRELAFDYRGTSARPGETLTASAKWGGFDQDIAGLLSTDPAAGTPTLLRQARTTEERSGTLKADYVRPLGGARRLSFGGQLVYTFDRLATAQSGDLPFGAGSFAVSSLVRGSWIEHAGYVTYQFGLAGFTILPGIRIEGREYDLRSAAAGPGLQTSHVFPSLHLERPLARWLTGDASYSRRITYPPIQLLDPTPLYGDATTGFGGNPGLRPQLTDSFEAKLHATLTHHNLDLTLFRRTTDDIWSPRSDFDAAGALVTRYFNFGRQGLTGGEISARGPLARGLRYVLTANLADQSLDADAGGPLGTRHNTAYSMTGQLEYKDGTDGRRGADRINLTLRYTGVNDTGFARFSAYATATATWSHGITDRLSSVLTVADLQLTPAREVISNSGAILARDLGNPPIPRVTFSLTWSFRPPGQGPQVRQAPAPALPAPQ